MTIPSTISGGGYRLCCCDDEEGECDCECVAFDDEENPIAQCQECCWSDGDLVEYRHTWEAFSEKRTCVEQGLFGPSFGVKCWVDTYKGGSVEANYRMTGCGIRNGEIYRKFSLEAKGPNIVFNKGMGRYEYRGSGFDYPLPWNLLLFCGTTGEPGNYLWQFANADLSVVDDFRACVARCHDSCAAASETTSPLACTSTGWDWGSHCDQSNPPCALTQNQTPCWCNDCTKKVDDCGGMIMVCLMAKRDSACHYQGRAYGQFLDPNTNQYECAFGCEDDPDENPSTPLILESECSVGSADVLSILPPDGDARNCLWRIEEECCHKVKTMPPGVSTSDVAEPDEPDPQYPDVSTCPPATNQDPTGAVSAGCANVGAECDCFTNLNDWGCCEPESDDPDTICESGFSVAGRYGIICT